MREDKITICLKSTERKIRMFVKGILVEKLLVDCNLIRYGIHLHARSEDKLLYKVQRYFVVRPRSINMIQEHNT